jgi:hypothetical protein
MTRSAADDIKMVEGWGYTRSEALEMVTRRAVFEARLVADTARHRPDRDKLEGHLRYLDELRAICLASTRHTHAAG